jgi:hypothetical protein
MNSCFLDMLHNCPYDIKTAYSLESAAYTVVGQWDLAYLATLLFSDFQVDYNYLPRRFQEVPYHVRVLSDYCQGVGQITAATYKQILHGEVNLKLSKAVIDAAKEIEVILLSNRSWHTKVQMMAVILERMRIRDPRLFSKKKVTKHITENPLSVREDFHPASLKLFNDTLGSILPRNHLFPPLLHLEGSLNLYQNSLGYVFGPPAADPHGTERIHHLPHFCKKRYSRIWTYALDRSENLQIF